MTKTVGQINVNFVKVIHAISNLSFPGAVPAVQVKDSDEIPENALLLCPIIYPKPDGVIMGEWTGPETFGTGGAEQMTLKYDITLRYLHAQISGGLGGLFQVFPGMLVNIAAIYKVLLTNDTLTGADNVWVKPPTKIGPVTDPAGNLFHGCDFVISVEEYT